MSTDSSEDRLALWGCQAQLLFTPAQLTGAASPSARLDGVPDGGSYFPATSHRRRKAWRGRHPFPPEGRGHF